MMCNRNWKWEELHMIQHAQGVAFSQLLALDTNAQNAPPSIFVKTAKQLFLMIITWSKWNFYRRAKKKKKNANSVLEMIGSPVKNQRATADSVAITRMIKIWFWPENASEWQSFLDKILAITENLLKRTLNLSLMSSLNSMYQRMKELVWLAKQTIKLKKGYKNYHFILMSPRKLLNPLSKRTLLQT